MAVKNNQNHGRNRDPDRRSPSQGNFGLVPQLSRPGGRNDTRQHNLAEPTIAAHIYIRKVPASCTFGGPPMEQPKFA